MQNMGNKVVSLYYHQRLWHETGKEASLESIRVVFENIETLCRAELGLDTDSAEASGRDLVGDPGEVHVDQGGDDVVPDGLPTETSHHGVQVVEELRADVLRPHLQPQPHHRPGTELRQTGHRAQSVPQSPGLGGREETVSAHLQTVQSEIIKVQHSKVARSHLGSWLPQAREGSWQVCQIVVVDFEVFQVGQFPQGWWQTLYVVLADVHSD